ncbi:Protein of unknown function [Roseovarius litoreus]|uniref:ATP-dependent transcriptional regulator n=1 Tax=Roseovarius litoreus TaxID=1155722 RepID=A0A1M7GN01_9RHOB|nr:DUF2927 domain-containing protein [Roseovarius litoreus]SHM17556.1 Protein of unknown function [Roseovarius litoreus]
MRRIIIPLCLALGACVPNTASEMPSRAATHEESAMPAMKMFGSPQPMPPARSNRDIERDFLELAFQLESGRTLPYLSRFDGPITIRVTGSPPPTLMPDLNRVVNRLRTEAGIDVMAVRGGDANITVEAVSRSDIRRHLPQAACFVVPNISSLAEYSKARHTRATNWSLLTERQRLAVFLPNDASPQEVRDCLHEELAQAIGPLNDLYRLPDSVFNDDNVHTVLTGFDMLILRAYYAPELRSGMTRAQVAARLPGILSRLNPIGDTIAPRNSTSTPRAWVRAIQTALGPGARPPERREAALEALQIAQAVGWQDHRLAFSHFALGRLSQSTDPDFAHDQFLIADRIYRQSPGTDLHRAYTASQLAAYAISEGRGNDALKLVEPHLAVAKSHENAALLATLMMLQAEALDQVGRVTEAHAVRLDSLGWARYGFGADWAVRAKLREITMLNPIRGSDG